MLDMLHFVTILALFVAAWLISRCAAWVARVVLRWHDRRTEAASATVDVRIATVKRRETIVAMVRAAIAYVPQDPAMFHRSIADNIRIGRPEAGDSEIIEAARLANAFEFIDVLPSGF